ncbi:patatin-like phospholipase family protein [Membranicola marinus]|uniref:Patatin-like phospholipase family protein n=1 Tax=Membranihabitans marinus TaxID=1227546 RepID=A0A953L776_9BACT|nr:patatin-like phospholipase family protein [Membranihabitans marinus]MBY5958437.1 patatin-like phospholipase family protein [Membranihabitans marinus]
MNLPPDFKIGLTLSGGASYGIAHVGVVKALREYGIEPHILYGTSAGAIVAALYAGGASIRDMRRFIKENNILSMRRLRLPKLGFIPLTYLENRLTDYIPFENLEDLPRRTMIGATNLETGQHESVESGPVSKAVAASCAIPVFFRPIEHNGSLFVDGGVSNNMPAFPLRGQCDFIIGSDVVEAKQVDRKYINGFKRLLERTLTISLANRTVINYKDCDFVIRPKGMYQYAKFDFSRSDEFIEYGYHQALIDLPKILEGIRKKIKEKKEKSSVMP